ncbi:MAG: Gfo/Idh/MocA family oxidoreductase [Clostridia bacterium]|nr:Gfo/Idh/MocA family oxidoreductase [Clostridia bacterium]
MSVNFAILGSGMSAALHAKALSGLKGSANAVGFFSVDEESAREFSLAYGIPQYSSYDRLLDDPAVDAVIICTPSGLHAEHAVAAMKKGKNVLVEKPAVVTPEQAETLLRAEREYDIKVASVSQLRLFCDVKKLKKDISRGTFGKITLATLNMNYYRPQSYYDMASWRGSAKLDGGTLMNQGLHGIDLLIYFFGQPVMVSAFRKTAARQMESEDTAAAIIEFRNGVYAVVSASSCTYPGSPRRLEICGTEGSAVLTEDKITLRDTVRDGKWHAKPSDYLSFNDPAAVPQEAHREVLRNFADHIEHGTPPISTLADGCNSACLIDAVYRSADTGESVVPRYFRTV